MNVCRWYLGISGWHSFIALFQPVNFTFVSVLYYTFRKQNDLQDFALPL